MSNFGHVIRVFLSLDPSFQKVIADITRRMGEGMAEFIEKEVSTKRADYEMVIVCWPNAKGWVLPGTLNDAQRLAQAAALIAEQGWQCCDGALPTRDYLRLRCSSH